MGSCASCGCDIGEVDSNPCLGFPCERRLCITCFSASGGYCPKCELAHSIEDERMRPGSGDTLTYQYEDRLEDINPIVYEIEVEQSKGDEASEEKLKGLYKKLKEERERGYDGTFRDRSDEEDEVEYSD